jgi:carbamoylphosphate synthase large subunit
MTPFDPPPALLEAIERMLRPLDYSGPCNIDYTIRELGRVAVFEINVRFGGALFLAEKRDRLKAALGCLVGAAAQQTAR